MTIEGMYQKTIFRNIKTGFTVFTFKTLTHLPDGRKLILCRGTIPTYANKTPLKITGEFVTSEKGDLFAMQSVEINITDNRLLHSFILANLPAGMGTACAERFVQYLSSHHFTLKEFLERDDVLQHMLQIKGFERKKSIVILKKIEESFSELMLLKKLSPYGISLMQINRLRALYQARTQKEITENPYFAMRKANIPFNNIDAYAKSLDFTFCDPARIRELVNHTYAQLPLTGNSYLPYEQILQLFRRLENTSACFDQAVPEPLVLLELLSSRAGYVDMSRGKPLFYSKSTWEAENNIAAHMLRLKNTASQFISKQQITDFLQEDKNILDESQKEAFDLLQDTSPVFLVGGPGTGKTTTLKKLVECIRKYKPDKKISICAPTGRAAERIKEATGEEAATIHLLLEYRLDENGSYPMRTEANPIDSEIVIIDEFSMVGIFLFSSLLNALQNGVKLIIVGDWNQLPSIEPGYLLHDLVNSRRFPYKQLTRIHRQGENSIIVENAQKILNGDVRLEQHRCFQILRFQNDAELRMKLKDIYKKYHDMNDFRKFHVLTPMRGGAAGVEALNLFAQEIFHSSDEPCLSYGSLCFYEGDKVMTQRNNYDKGYYNGDLMSVKSFQGNDLLTLSVQDDVTLDLEYENIEDATLAYAMTVHKCQGSEGDIIAIVLPSDIPSVMINRALLYTAVTRAKKKVMILSSGDCLERFIQSALHPIRQTGINWKITEAALPQRNS